MAAAMLRSPLILSTSSCNIFIRFAKLLFLASSLPSFLAEPDLVWPGISGSLTSNTELAGSEVWSSSSSPAAALFFLSSVAKSSLPPSSSVALLSSVDRLPSTVVDWLPLPPGPEDMYYSVRPLSFVSRVLQSPVRPSLTYVR